MIEIESGFEMAHPASFLLIGTIYLLCRIEPGSSVTVDEKPEVELDSTLAVISA